MYHLHFPNFQNQWNSKRILLFTLLISLLLSYSCSQEISYEATVLPLPASISYEKGNLHLAKTITVYVSDEKLNPLAGLLQKHMKMISNTHFEITSNSSSANIIFLLENGFEAEEYKLIINDKVTILASDYNAMALGLSSLIQLMREKGEKIIIPKQTISDKPDFEYRTVMLDVARFGHPIETIEETIDLLWFYKIPYLHLHLSDNRRFTFPLEEFPDLKIVREDGTREYYTEGELGQLVEYAKQRGIAIIPEIDLPGHSGQLWGKYPEVFGSIDPDTEKAKPLYVVNMAKEETYEACELIIIKLAKIFYTSPYIHFGGDEVYLEVLKSIPEYKAYCNEHNLKVALEGDANELFCHFINRLHNMVKATSKKTIIWEGFHGTGSGSETIDNEIEVIVWNTNYNHPQNLLDNGFKIVNSTWIPWYLVGAMNLSAPQDIAYNWDVTQWSHWNENKPDVILDSKAGILGGQICFWEQNHYKVIPELKSLVPVLSERLWNNNSTSDFEGFANRYSRTRAIYKKLFHPIKIEVPNLFSQEDKTFLETVEINLTAQTPGTIKYNFSDSWKLPDMSTSTVFDKPIKIDNSGILTTQLFDPDNLAIGFPVQKYYQRIVPAYHYKVFQGAPQHGWTEMPDFNNLEVIREGVSGLMTSERLEKINGELFAKVKEEGHIEVRFNKIYNPYALELKGTINCPVNTNYQFRIQTHDGLAELTIDDQLVGKGESFDNEPENFSVQLTAGNHPIVIKYFYKNIQNQLSILYKTDEMDDFKPFENLVQAIH